MAAEYTMERILKTFHQANELYVTLVENLVSPTYTRLEHGEVEAHLERHGRELLRSLYQAYPDNHTRREERLAGLEGQDAVVRTHVRPASRQMETVFGAVIVTRPGYGARGHEQLRPLDCTLNLPKDRIPMRCVAGLRSLRPRCRLRRRQPN